MKIMAIDYGDARTGMAVSDLTGSIVGETWVITEWNQQVLAEKIIADAKSRNIEKAVLGYPKNMDGSEGPRCEKCMELKELLNELHPELEVILWDERMTTIQAHAILHANGKKEKKHRKNVDAVAASLILEGYLGSI